MRYTLIAKHSWLTLANYRNRTSAIGNARHIARLRKQTILVYFGNCVIAQIAW